MLSNPVALGFLYLLPDLAIILIAYILVHLWRADISLRPGFWPCY